jgi:nitrite reductase (NO-forming)
MTHLASSRLPLVGRRNFLLTTAAGLSLAAVTESVVAATPAAAATTTDLSMLQRVKQKLVAPPFLPEHEQVANGDPRIIEIELVIEEKKMVLDDDGTEVWAMTYNGSVPGPMIVVHEGDYVELTLKNLPTNVLEHNIDFHAATGALGGGALTKVMPGEQAVLRWKAVKPGVFVYHCAPGDVMIPYHVVHGMNGAIMVLPRDGLKDGKGNPVKYDKAYFIGEQDYYIPRDEKGNFKKYESAGENMSDALEVMRTLTPTHVVFNGRKGALTDDNALIAKVGETVLFIHAQANRDTRPHLIGGHGDFVWDTGSFADVPATGLETWFIRGGSAGAMAYKFRQPGVYAYVNHNLIEAVMLGATAHVVVDGEWNDDLMMQVAKPAAYTN